MTSLATISIALLFAGSNAYAVSTTLDSTGTSCPGLSPGASWNSSTLTCTVDTGSSFTNILNIPAGDDLTIDEDVTLEITSMARNNILSNDGTITNNGKIVVLTSFGTSTSASATISNMGTFENNGTIEIDNSASPVTSGQSSVSNYGTFVNNGEISIDNHVVSEPTGVTSTLSNSADSVFGVGTFVNHGVIHVDNNGLARTAAISTVSNNGEFTNFGDITTEMNGSAGTVTNSIVENSPSFESVFTPVFENECDATITTLGERNSVLNREHSGIVGIFNNAGIITADTISDSIADTSDKCNIAPVCSEAVPSTSSIWPVNHKMVPITIDGVTDEDGDEITIVITSIMQDEPVNGLGDGDTSPDGDGVGTSTAEVRAERSGTSDGRVYIVSFAAFDGRGGMCMESVEVGVPHDKKDVAIFSGVFFDSTS